MSHARARHLRPTPPRGATASCNASTATATAAAYAALLIVAAALPCAGGALASHTLRHRQRGGPGAQPSVLSVGLGAATEPSAAATTESATPPEPVPAPRLPPPPPPLEVTARLHQAARLPCAVLGGGAGGGATWRHGERRVPGDAETHRYALEPRSGELRVSNVRAEDAGLWHCEPRLPGGGGVMPTRPVMLLVTDPPRAPYLEVDGRRLDPGNVFLPVLEGAPLAVGCVAEGGLPAPELSWRLGGVPVEAAAAAAAAGGAAAAALGAAGGLAGFAGGGGVGGAAAAAVAQNHARVRSEVRLPRVLRAHHNATVTCLVRHSALPRPLNASLLLDVQYTPSFAISREPGFGFPLVEGIPVSLKCEVDANPPSAPLWLKDDGPPPVTQSADGFLNFSAIRREHSGWYKCTSREFSSIGYFLNVRYEESPEVTMDPGPGEASSTHRQVEVALGGAVQLQCPLVAPANGGGGGANGANGGANGANGGGGGGAATPACWSRVGAGGALEPLAAGPELSLERVLYQEAGTFRCAAPAQPAPSPALQQWRNLLDVTVSVSGRPTVKPSNTSVSALTGQAVALAVEFCANPPADRALWLTAEPSLLRPGEAYGRLTAHPVEETNSPYCRHAVLMLHDVRPSDAGEYAFQVRSPRGLAEGSVTVNVTRASGYALGAAAARHAHPAGPAALLLLLLVLLAATLQLTTPTESPAASRRVRPTADAHAASPSRSGLFFTCE